MGSQQTMKPQTGLIRVPLNYPSAPTPGKLQLLLENNEKSIYHRYSPYAEYANGLVDKILGFGAKQPFIYDYIDEARKGLSGLRRFEGRIFPIGSAPRDVIRVSKFLASGPGILFLGKQFLLQTTNAFNETRVYNPTSPIVAAGMGLTLGMVRPQRNIDISGGLGGLARNVIGNTIPNLFGSSTVSPPYGTIGSSLPISNSSEGKGLLRAQTANRAKSILESRWNNSKSKKSGLLGLAKSLFSNFIPQKQDSTIRSDEEAYGLMIGNGSRFSFIGRRGDVFEFGQRWVAGGSNMRANEQYPTKARRIFSAPDGGYYWMPNNQINSLTSFDKDIGKIGYSIDESNDPAKPGVRYADSIGTTKDGEFASSDIMVQYSYYANKSHDFDYPTKKSDKKSTDEYNEELNRVITSLKKSGIYDINIPTNSKTMTSPNRSADGYNQLFFTTQGMDRKRGLGAKNYPLGLLRDYTNIRTVDNSISTDSANKSLKLPGAGNFDAINTLKILPGKNSENPRSIANTKIPNWNTWSPYKDDQIAFFFYDVVNDKYIPFRATVKGITEQSSANWEELSFIGRADRLYSYSGFSRTLNFNFDVVIGSIIELAPTWKRINYLMSLSKPAGYTKSKQGTSLPYNKFMIPPMVMVTIGDLYKEQPIMINSLNITIPDDADWETLNEENSNKEWSYLSDYMKSSKVERLYGQFPMEAKLSVTCYLLEKERAIMGAANFGHAPHTDAYLASDTHNQPHIHKNLVDYQFDHASPSTWVDHKVVSPISTVAVEDMDETLMEFHDSGD